MLNIVMADQPSGGAELLASGTYTLASSTNPMTIPISYTGKAVFVAVKGTETGGTWAWLAAKTSEAFQNIYPDYYPGSTTLQKITYATSSQAAENKMTATTTEILCYQRDNNYKIKADTFTWSVWGLK